MGCRWSKVGIPTLVLEADFGLNRRWFQRAQASNRKWCGFATTSNNFVFVLFQHPEEELQQTFFFDLKSSLDHHGIIMESAWSHHGFILKSS